MTDSGYPDAEGPLELVGERFAGELLHPVPLLEMDIRFGIARRGWKIVASWPDCVQTYQIKLGDDLEVEGKRFRVLGVRQHRPCFLDIYMTEAA
jgi:hypothetical protein